MRGPRAEDPGQYAGQGNNPKDVGNSGYRHSPGEHPLAQHRQPRLWDLLEKTHGEGPAIRGRCDISYCWKE